MRKEWYDPRAGRAVRTRAEARALDGLRRRSARGPSATLGACLLYPITDGPGVAFLIVLPPVLWALSLPIFDVIAYLEPIQRGNWTLGLLALPVLTPLLLVFGMTFGYALLVLGQMLVASAMGETDHPRWPEWNSEAIAEGLGRWLWAAVFGVALGGFPALTYWLRCGKVDWFDLLIFAELVLLGAGYAQMTLAAALLHENILAANPVAVLLAIVRIGWDYVVPSLAAGLALLVAGATLWAVLCRMPSQAVAAVALWGFWVLAAYAAMVVVRLLGLTYHAHAADLAWFQTRPKWATHSRSGRIYTNS